MVLRHDDSIINIVVELLLLLLLLLLFLPFHCETVGLVTYSLACSIPTAFPAVAVPVLYLIEVDIGKARVQTTDERTVVCLLVSVNLYSTLGF